MSAVSVPVSNSFVPKAGRMFQNVQIKMVGITEPMSNVTVHYIADDFLFSGNVYVSISYSASI